MTETAAETTTTAAVAGSRPILTRPMDPLGDGPVVAAAKESEARPLAAAPEPPAAVAAARHADRLVLSVVHATNGLTAPGACSLARRMRLTVSAVLLFATGARRPGPRESAAIRRAAARRALQRLASQIALGQTLGHFDAAAAVKLLEDLTAVAVELSGEAQPGPSRITAPSGGRVSSSRAGQAPCPPPIAASPSGVSPPAPPAAPPPVATASTAPRLPTPPPP